MSQIRRTNIQMTTMIITLEKKTMTTMVYGGKKTGYQLIIDDDDNNCEKRGDVSAILIAARPLQKRGRRRLREEGRCERV